MQKSPTSLQDTFLNKARKEKIAVTIHLMNGFQIKGIIKGFDNFSILMDCDGKQMLIYKHAASTITPSEVINFTSEDR